MYLDLSIRLIDRSGGLYDALVIWDDENGQRVIRKEYQLITTVQLAHLINVKTLSLHAAGDNPSKATLRKLESEGQLRLPFDDTEIYQNLSE